MDQITVRSECADDIKAIDVVHLSAFEGDDEVGLIETLRQSSNYVPDLSLVAEFNKRIVGHILLTRVRLQNERDGVDILALAPMAVVPSQSHRGIGTELVEHAIRMAAELGYGAVVVAGHPDYYQRLGFKPASDWDLHCSLPISPDLFSAIELTENCLCKGGNIIYPSVFTQVY